MVFVISRVAGRSRGGDCHRWWCVAKFLGVYIFMLSSPSSAFSLLYLTTLFSTLSCFSTDIAHVQTPITYLVTANAVFSEGFSLPANTAFT